MNKPKAILAFVALLSLAAGHFLRQETRVDERVLLRELAPDATFSAKSGSPPVYRSGQGLVAFNSYDVTPSVRGYAGPIKVLLVLGDDGRIRGIKLLSHRETKNYVHYLETPAYLGRFVGKSIFDRFEVDRDIDGISRATVSVEALAKTVRESSRAVAGNVYGLQAGVGQAAAAGDWSWAWYAAVFLFGGTGYVLTRRGRRLERMRDLSLAAGIVIIGLYLASPFSVLHVFNLVLLRPSSSLLWYAIVGSTLVSLLVAGRFYCGWLCPFGALSELISRVPLRKWVVPPEQDDRWRSLKYVLLTLATAAVFLSGWVDHGNYEAYITLFAFHGNAFAWTLVALSLLANLRVPRFWCRYLCPVAAFSAVLARQDPLYVSRHDCPMGNKPDPETGECIRCNRCYHPK
jgi:NosR/NirI family transcriptional regulator, nitrous oxide reductase regulator